MHPTEEKIHKLVEEQNAPIPNKEVSCWDLVLADMHERDKIGRERYKTPLQPNNGRDPLVDAYQESLDQSVYLRQEIEERPRKEVYAFAKMMERKLKKHDAQKGKEGWKNMDPLALFKLLEKQVEELGFSSRGCIASTAVNVANFAMMIADVCGELE